MNIDFILLGKRIAKRRHKLGYKQCVIAEKAGISNNYLSNIENGKSIPSLETFASLCCALSTTPDYLLLGIIKNYDTPKEILDNLSKCNAEDLKTINDIIICFTKNKNNKTTRY